VFEWPNRAVLRPSSAERAIDQLRERKNEASAALTPTGGPKANQCRTSLCSAARAVVLNPGSQWVGQQTPTVNYCSNGKSRPANARQLGGGPAEFSFRQKAISEAPPWTSHSLNPALTAVPQRSSDATDLPSAAHFGLYHRQHAVPVAAVLPNNGPRPNATRVQPAIDYLQSYQNLANAAISGLACRALQ